MNEFNPLTNEQIQYLKQMLTEEKTDLDHRLDENNEYGLAYTFRESTGELSNYDNHPADTATDLYEREKDMALKEKAESHLAEVITALNHIQAGSYGYCYTCNSPIPYERLEAIPTTVFCIHHVPERDISMHRHVEELLLSPPFGRASLDELACLNQFDGENTWQIVESWGNSDSPAMAEGREIHNYNDFFAEADENDGYVEDYESFIATDLYGHEISIVRNKAYRDYMAGPADDDHL